MLQVSFLWASLLRVPWCTHVHSDSPLCSVNANRDLLKGLAFFRLSIECVTRTINKSSDWSASGEVESFFALPGDIRDHSPPAITVHRKKDNLT